MSDQPPGSLAGRRTSSPPDQDGVEVRRRSQLLCARGFQSTEVVDPSTARAALMWVRVWRGVRDVVIGNFDGALAYRVWDADFDPREPFRTEDDITLWRAIGSFLEVSGQLLDLETPQEHSHFPRRRRRAANGAPVSGEVVREVAHDQNGQHADLRACG